jgi:zinc/manganese transport system ATP-binding protein
VPPRRGSSDIGYIPQQKSFDRDLPIRGIDLVRLGLDGHRWGIGLPSRRRRRRVEEAIASVGAAAFARFPIGNLSGGEQQRLRVAQALVGDPQLLLCDEPLLSLDLKHQREVVELINAQRRASAISVLFVTHEINPIMSVVDRVLYLVGTRWAVGTPAEIFTSARLSELYQTDVEVLEVGGRIVIVGAPDSPHAEAGSSHYHHALGQETIVR